MLFICSDKSLLFKPIDPNIIFTPIKQNKAILICASLKPLAVIQEHFIHLGEDD